MSDVIAPIVADTDELSSGEAAVPVTPVPPIEIIAQEAPNGPLIEGVELLERNRNGGAQVRKTRSGASSSGSSTKPSLSSRLDNLKISTIRQHYYPEGGWGWVICACAFAINMLTSGLLLSYGILHQEVLKEFGEEHADKAMWLGSLALAMGYFLSPLIVAFCRRKSTRLTAVFGGLTAALGCLFTSFASQMHQVFVSYGFVMAVGLSLARVTSSLMIGQYFKRRREKVEIIVTSGTGCGVIVFSYSFSKIIRTLGWRLGLHAITGMAVVPFFIGICYRSASLYHPQRRAILHLKNQRKKIKDKSGVSDKPPFFDWAPLRSRPILMAMLSAAVCALGLYAPFFHLVLLLTSEGLQQDSILLIQFHLGTAFMVGCVVFGVLLVKKNAECIVGKQYLCQAAMIAIGFSYLSVHSAKDYYGFVLFSWMYGVPCGGLHYSLKMLVFEKIRAKSFSRAWAYVEWVQSVPVLIGIPVTGYINGNHDSRSGFYFTAACSFAGATALFLNNITYWHPSNRRRGQGSCSTCTSQTPSCCCTQEFNIQSRPGSSGSHHPKCQKTISFSDTVDFADEESPRRYPYTGKRFENQNDLVGQQPNVAEDNWGEVEIEENVDVENIDENVVICYDNGNRCPTNSATIILEDRKPVNRYTCGHLEGELTDNVAPPLPRRQMTIIEEVTSSV